MSLLLSKEFQKQLLEKYTWKKEDFLNVFSCSQLRIVPNDITLIIYDYTRWCQEDIQYIDKEADELPKRSTNTLPIFNPEETYEQMESSWKQMEEKGEVNINEFKTPHFHLQNKKFTFFINQRL